MAGSAHGIYFLSTHKLWGFNSLFNLLFMNDFFAILSIFHQKFVFKAFSHQRLLKVWRFYLRKAKNDPLGTLPAIFMFQHSETTSVCWHKVCGKQTTWYGTQQLWDMTKKCAACRILKLLRAVSCILFDTNFMSTYRGCFWMLKHENCWRCS